jgi:hypothetical protein
MVSPSSSLCFAQRESAQSSCNRDGLDNNTAQHELVDDGSLSGGREEHDIGVSFSEPKQALARRPSQVQPQKLNGGEMAATQQGARNNHYSAMLHETR